MRRELRNLKTGQHGNKRENTTREMRMDEKIAHERTGHATYDPSEKRLKMPRVSTHPRKAVADAAHFDHATAKNSQQRAEVKIWVGGPRRKRLRGPCIAKERTSKIFCAANTLWNILAYCAQEECLREVAHSKAVRLGLPTRVTAVEQSQANGRAEKRVQALRERLQIMVEDARRRGIEIVLDHPVAQWAVRHARWTQKFLVMSDVDLSDGGTIKKNMKHTHETKHRAMLLEYRIEFLFAAESTMTNSPDFWSVGHLVTKTLTSSLSWKTEVCLTTVRRNTVPKDAVLQTFMNIRMSSQ